MTTTRRTVPACWTWPAPSEASLARLAERMLKEGRSYKPFGPVPYPDHDYLRWRLMVAWHRDRCAVCGARPAKLIDDHDHYTNLFRGFLCRSCNAREGCGGDPIFDRWAERNPAVIFNIKSFRYQRWNPLSGQRGPKQPPHYG